MSDYKGQLINVLLYINLQIQKDWANTDSNAFNQAVCKEVLAEVACMSPRNFQFYFKSYFKESFGVYIDRLRREFALQLIQEGQFTHTEIAERVGYANDTALYNVFKKKYQYTPSEYKEQITRNKKFITDKINCRIEILKETPVIFLSYIGDYDNFSSSVFEEESWDKLYDFALSQDILSEKEEYWGICYDNQEITDPDKCRFYACLTISNLIQPKITDEIKYMTIPSAQYAVFTYVGAYDGLDHFYDISIQSIPSKYRLSDDLILEHYLNSSTDTAETELVTELWIPIIQESTI